jgi:hypothetical protein
MIFQWPGAMKYLATQPLQCFIVGRLVRFDPPAFRDPLLLLINHEQGAHASMLGKRGRLLGQR